MEYLTLKEVSKRTGVSEPTLRRWCAEGRISEAQRSPIRTGKGQAWLIPDTAEIPIPKDEGKRAEKYEFSPKNEGLTELA